MSSNWDRRIPNSPKFQSNYTSNNDKNKTNFIDFRCRKVSTWQISEEDIKFSKKISERYDPETMGDSQKDKIDYYRQPSKEVAKDPRDLRNLPKPLREFKQALLNTMDSEWIRGEPPRHILINQISSKQVRTELNLFALLEEMFQLSENDIVSINLLPIDSEKSCASILFSSGHKAWETVRLFNANKRVNELNVNKITWTIQSDQGGNEFERIKQELQFTKNRDRDRDRNRDRDRDRDIKRDNREDYSFLDDYYGSDDQYRNERKQRSRLSCNPFVPCLKIPFSCESSLPFRLHEDILFSLFPVSKFPSFAGIEEGGSSWHVHFGREIDLVEADRMLQNDVFMWDKHQFYFEKWKLTKGNVPWTIPEHYKTKSTEKFDKSAIVDESVLVKAELPEIPDEEELKNVNKKSRPAKANPIEDAEKEDFFKNYIPSTPQKIIETPKDVVMENVPISEEVKVKVKRKPVKKMTFVSPPLSTILKADEQPVTPVNDAKEKETVQDEIIDISVDGPILKSGSARTEGFFRLEPEEKLRVHFYGILEAFSSSVNPTNSSSSSNLGNADIGSSSGRSSRIQNRRPLLQSAGLDLFKVSPLQSTQKLVSLRNSSIHSYGLVLMEPADPGDLIIEYVGELVRASVANIREWKYEREYRGDGIASSYLFRLDGIMVIDATYQGNLARFINHSCDPNCVAKTITLNGSKRIVMYAKKFIKPGEEITYDYKFPTEKDPKKKVKCLCGSNSCRKFLN